MATQRSWLGSSVAVVLLWSCGPVQERGAEDDPLALARSALAGPVGFMADARSNFTATLMFDGTVMLAGGQGSGSAMPVQYRAELFHPGLVAFASTPEMSEPRYGHAAIRIGEEILLVGGNNNQGYIPAAMRYVPSTNQWVTASAPTNRYLPAVARLWDGRILVTGGYEFFGTSVQSSAAIYDRATDSSSGAAPMSVARYGHSMVTLADGRVMAAGGLDINNNSHKSVEFYDSQTNTWTAGPPMVGEHGRTPLLLLPDGDVIASGGPVVERFVVGAEQWITVATLPTNRTTLIPYLGNDGALYLVGGWLNGARTASVDRVDLVTGAVTAAAPLSEPRHVAASAVLGDGTLFIAGGSDGSGGQLSSAEIYGEAACAPTSCAEAGAQCGTLPDGCGGSLTCGECTGGEVCDPQTNSCCAPSTCQDHGAQCGTVPDGCGGTIECGECGAGEVCGGSNACCAPTTCAAAGAQCGSIPDGCGGTLSCGGCGAGEVCSTGNFCEASPAAQYDGTYKAPACLTLGSACDSMGLLNGRGAFEPSQPNTLYSACPDGSSGSYHVDESLDRLRISTLDGSPLAAGKVVQVEATVWAYSSSANKLDLYRSLANNLWTHVATLTPPGSGVQVLTTTFTLPPGEWQAIRGVFRYGGSAGSCVSGGYNDHDDLVFRVETPPDTQAPVVTLTSPVEGQTVTGSVTLSVNVSDDQGVTRVDYHLDGSYLNASLGAPWSMAYNSRTFSNGPHTLSARAYDAAGNVGQSAMVNFTVANDTTAPQVTLTSPAPGATLSGTVMLTANASDDVGLSKVEFRDGASVIGVATEPPYQVLWNTTTAANGTHQLTARAWDTSSNVTTTPATLVTVQNVSSFAAWDASLRVPRCAAQLSSCDSGTLLTGRAHLGPEPNQPNTLAASHCADGTGGTFHSDESLDRLKISTLDGSPLAPGKLARVEATVWAFSGYTSDKLDVYYASDAYAPAWVFAGTLTPTKSGAGTLSLTYTLPAGSVQAVRGVFRYGGSASPCASGSYNDRDDLAFRTAP